MRPTLPILAVTAGLMVACQGGEPAEEQSAPTGADSVAAALAAFDPAAFDSISWDTHEAALERGGVVFRFSCRKCHGEGGAGDGGFVASGDTLQPPSFLTEEWQFADDREALRQHIFTGTADGMPHWGLEGLKYRDIDAVSYYILETLRTQ